MAYYPQNGDYGGQDGGHYSGPSPAQRRPPPNAFDDHGRGPGGPPPTQGYLPRKPAPGQMRPNPQAQAFDRGYDSTPPFSPADSRDGGRGYGTPGPGRGPSGPSGYDSRRPVDRPPPPPQRSYSEHEYARGNNNQGGYGRDGREGPSGQYNDRGQQRPADRQRGPPPRQDRALKSPVSPETMSWDNPFPAFPNAKKEKPKESSNSDHSGGSSHQGLDRNQSGESTHSRRHHGPIAKGHGPSNSWGDTNSMKSPPPRSNPAGGYDNGHDPLQKPLPQPANQRRPAIDHGAATDYNYDPPQPPFGHAPQEGRSNTMPDRGFPNLNQDMPYRGRNPPQEDPTAGRSFSFGSTVSPISPPQPPFEGRRADSSGVLERFDRGGLRGPEAYNDPNRGPVQYEETFDNYQDQDYGPNGAEEEDMPNFDSPSTNNHNNNTNVDPLFMGGAASNRGRGERPDGRGRVTNRGQPHDFGGTAARSRSQPNFRDGPADANQGYGPAPDMPPMPREYGQGRGGYGGPGPARGGIEHSETWSPAMHQQDARGGPGQYPAPQRGPQPPRGPPAQFQSRPTPPPSGYGQGPGQGPPHQRGGSAGAGQPPYSQDLNPDALPSHPTPVRPGLMQDGGMGGPPPQRQFGTPGPMGGMVRAETMQAPISASAVPAPKQTSAPVTQEDIRRLRAMTTANPNDSATALELSQKLVEASSTLIGEKGRVDQKTRNKSREKFLGEAFKLLRKLAGYNYPPAMFFLADCYGRDVGGRGLFTPLPDQREAFSLYQAAAKANNPQAAYRVAVCCEMGQDEGGGTRRDPLKALQWYKRAATLGDTPAMYKMGIILLKGLLGQPRNAAEAINYLQQAADRADDETPHALHELGLLFESGALGDGVPRDEPYAMQLFARGAQLGYKFSQYRLGSAFEYGSLGCPVDPRQSIAWYSKAAVQEEHQSELALSGWYLTGSDGVIQQSDTEAYLWARKAAHAGLSKAEYAMGYFTEVGIGAPADLEAAKRWYWRAASQNYPKARERLEDLRKGGARMQKAQVSRSDVKNNHKEGECVVM